MRSIIVLSTLLGLTCAAPRPQNIDTAGVEAAPDPVFIVPSYTLLEEDGATNEPAIAARRRLLRRDGTCAVQPAGSGPVSSPDTVEAFMSNPAYGALATSAPSPDGYSVVMINANASLSASNYMGLRTLKSFDTLGCAQLCDQTTGCQAFNMYIERDPSLDPNTVNCPNPPSITNFKCTMWGAAVSAAQATNKGQYRASFQVVITGSNAYNRASPPPEISCYTGPTKLPGAINAPLNAQGQNTYMGYKYHPFSQTQGYDPSTCAADCNAQTAYNSRHPAADGTYQTCVFFNAYVLSMNGVPQGLYCSMYTQVWAASYATNYGQYRGTDRYTVSRSYSYSLNSGSDGNGGICGPSTPSQSSTLSSISRISTVQTSTSQTSTSQTSTSESMTSSSSIDSTTTTQTTSSSSSSTADSEPATTSSSTTSATSTSTESTTSATSTSTSDSATSVTSTSTTESTTSAVSTTSSIVPTTSTTASEPTTFCLQDPSTGQFATLWRGGNGLSFGAVTKKNFPSLFTLDAQARLTSTITGYYAVLNLATFGNDGASQGHIEGVTLAQSTGNQIYRYLVCEVGDGSLVCRSAANYLDAAKSPVSRSQVLTTTQGNDGVDRYVFAPTSVAGAVPVRVLPASACGPNYS
ncbi:MAG: hypothetical protein Q9207_004127 [Kuettlingeria erythrocarpa]